MQVSTFKKKYTVWWEDVSTARDLLPEAWLIEWLSLSSSFHVSSFICFCQLEPICLAHSDGPSLTIASPLALSLPHRLVMTFSHCCLLGVLGFISQCCPCLLDYIWNMLPAPLEQALINPQVLVLLSSHCIKHSLPHSSPIFLGFGGTSEAVHSCWANTSFKQLIFLSCIFYWWLDTWSHKQHF